MIFMIIESVGNKKRTNYKTTYLQNICGENSCNKIALKYFLR